MKLFETWSNLNEGREDWIKENLGDKIIDAVLQDPTLSYEAEELRDPRYMDKPEAHKKLKDKILNSLLITMKNIDPTPNNKYLQWIVMRFINNEFLVGEDKEVIKDDLETFHEFKKYMDKKDINQYKTFADLREAIHWFKATTHDTVAEQHMIQKGDIAVTYEKNDERILIPKTYKASRYLAKDKHNTSWCTAYPNNYESYTKSGPLFIVELPDEPKGPFQFHFESAQYMDRNDLSIQGVEGFIDSHDSVKWLVDGYYNKHVLPDIDKFLKQIRNSDKILKRYVNNWSELFTFLEKNHSDFLWKDGILDAIDNTDLFNIDIDLVRTILTVIKDKKIAIDLLSRMGKFPALYPLIGDNLEEKYLDIIVSLEIRHIDAASALDYLYDRAQVISHADYLRYSKKLVDQHDNQDDSQDDDYLPSTGIGNHAMNSILSGLIKDFKSLPKDEPIEEGIREQFVEIFNQIKEFYESHRELSVWALYLIITEDILPLADFEDWAWNFLENKSKDAELPRWFYRVVVKTDAKEGWEALQGFMQDRSHEFVWRSNLKERIVDSLTAHGYEITQ